MHQRDPLKQSLNKRFLWLAVLFVILAIIDTVLDIFQYNASPAEHNFSTFLPALCMVLVAASFGCSLLIMKAVWKRRDPKRQRALEGDTSLLASEQPNKNEQALSLPTTLELHMKPTIYLFMMAFIVIVVTIMALIIALIVHISQAELLIFAAVLGAFLLFFFIIFGLGAYIGMRKARQKVTISAEGITTRYLSKTTTIPWHEARFFCVNGVEKLNRARVYELAGEKESALWTQIVVPKGIIRSAMLKPTIPFEEYDQKTRALLEVVAGKTGLPLYDLRDTSNKWYM
jgi:hypothetical protein